MSKSDRRTYDELTRLGYGQVGKKDPKLADYAMNSRALDSATLEAAKGFLTPTNLQWLRKFINQIGRAQYISQLDSLSQASIFLSTTEAPDKPKKKTPLDELPPYEGGE